MSHTAFSHLGDYVFYKSNQHKPYQNKVHLTFLKRFKVDKLVLENGISLVDLDPDLPAYKSIGQELPNLCADHIQYIIHTGVIFKKISKKEAVAIVDNLQFVNGEWYFTDPTLAEKLADLSLIFTKEFWESVMESAFNEYFAKAIKIAFNEDILKQEDIKYGVDEIVLEKLKKSKNKKILMRLNHLSDIQKYYDMVPYSEGKDYNVKPKFRRR